jgi:hypothetical protein
MGEFLTKVYLSPEFISWPTYSTKSSSALGLVDHSNLHQVQDGTGEDTI